MRRRDRRAQGEYRRDPRRRSLENHQTVQQCAMYVDVRITPAQEPMDVREDLRDLLAKAGLDGEVELYVFRPAFEADEKKAAPLRKAITQAHRQILGGEPKPAVIPASSMWRDLNCFNEMRIPSLCCGPGVSVGGGVFRMPNREPGERRPPLRRHRHGPMQSVAPAGRLGQRTDREMACILSGGHLGHAAIRLLRLWGRSATNFGRNGHDSRCGTG
jgi:hypothetical protein